MRYSPLALALALLPAAFGQSAWTNFAKDAQHLALSTTESQTLTGIHWQTPVDLDPQYSGSELLIHYGSPLITAADTVIVPVKTGRFGDFRVEAHNSATGSLVWSDNTDYILPPRHGWTPVFGPALTANRLYFPAAGGTIGFRDDPDSPTGAEGRLAFYGLSNYQADPAGFNSTVYIDTPLTTDRSGNLYFGFFVNGASPLSGLKSGIARIGADGQGTWIAVATAASNAAMTEVPYNCTPALNWDDSTLYIAASNGAVGYLLALDSTTLAPLDRVSLKDPISGEEASLSDDSSASPTVGPDGDVYYGVLENPPGENNGRGWLLHFDSTLSQTKTPGAFGWDTTASLVPASIVQSYTGTSLYLVMTKYNNYYPPGNGENKIAVLDPNATETDPINGATTMNEVVTALGPTPNPPVGVKEWCINSAAVDVRGKAILANSEDGKLYHWDLTNNTLSENVVLTEGLGEAYTPTVIGLDGTVYAINNAILFATGN